MTTKQIVYTGIFIVGAITVGAFLYKKFNLKKVLSTTPAAPATSETK